MDRSSDKRLTLLVCGLLSAGTLAAFWGVWSHDFIVYDDQAYLVGNAMVQRGLTWAGAAWAFTAFHAGPWLPLTWLSHMLDCQLYGLKPAGHHLTSLALHSLNAGLLFLALKRLTGALWRSALVAALFALHPMHVESFAWAAERKDVLSAFFFMLTLWAYGCYAESRTDKAESRKQKAEIGSQKPEAAGQWSVVRGLWSVVRSRWSLSPLPSSLFYLLALFFFALGLMSKPMLVTVPFVLLLLDYWPLRRMRNVECRMQNGEGRDQKAEGRGQKVGGMLHAPRSTLHASPLAAQSQIANRKSQILVEKLPFFALSALACVLTSKALAHEGALPSLAGLPFGARLSNALVAYLGYLEKTVWPNGLALLYVPPAHWPAWRIGLAVVVLAGISLMVLWLQRSANRPGSQRPTNGAAAERYCELPDKRTRCEPGRFALRPWLIVGWLWFMGMLVPVIGLMQVGDQYMADRYTYLPSIGFFIMVVWGGWELAANRNFNRRDAMDAEKASEAGSLYSSSPACSHPARNLQQANKPRNTRNTRKEALAGVPFPRIPRIPWLSSGGLGCGLAALRSSRLCGLGGAPFSVAAALRWVAGGLAVAVLVAFGALAVRQLGFWQNSETILTRCLAVTPDNYLAYNNLGVALAQQGRSQEARVNFETACQLQPRYADALRNLGVLLTDQGKFDEAAPYLAEAARMKPESGSIYGKLGLVLEAHGLPAQAIACYREGLRFLPGQIEPANNLAWLLATTPDGRLRDGNEAVRLAQQACEASGYKQPLVVGTLAAAYAEAGRFQEAVTTAQQAITLATAAGQPQLADRNRQLLELYRAGKPFRERNANPR